MEEDDSGGGSPWPCRSGTVVASERAGVRHDPAAAAARSAFQRRDRTSRCPGVSLIVLPAHPLHLANSLNE